MENNLRKHLLSNYAVMNDVGMMTKATIDTASAELSDPDEFRIAFKGPTALTENIESSDSDEIMLTGPTFETRGTETSDPDETLMEPTKHTFTVETSDEDEFLLM